MILQKIKRDAEEYLGDDVEKAVITVPAYFNDKQRQATKDAGEIAGFEVERIVNEPTAASMAYGLDDESNQTVLVRPRRAVPSTYQFSISAAASTRSSPRTGTTTSAATGDEALIDHLAKEFKNNHGIDLREDRQALQRLKDAAEGEKIELSSKRRRRLTSRSSPRPTAARSTSNSRSPARRSFENLTSDLIERTVNPTEQALSGRRPTLKSDIDEVILVGGSTRMPQVQEQVEALVGQEPKKNVNPDEAVALGAAVQGGVLSGDVDDIVLLDVTPLARD